MIEDEAKKKWCPMVRHGYGSEGVGVNRIHNNKTPSTSNCIGSNCMMWVHDQSVNDFIDGHCGLAGVIK